MINICSQNKAKNTRETNSYTESELDSNNRAHYADNLRDW